MSPPCDLLGWVSDGITTPARPEIAEAHARVAVFKATKLKVLLAFQPKGWQ
jgi:hypothetical protein